MRAIFLATLSLAFAATGEFLPHIAAAEPERAEWWPADGTAPTAYV
jgi:hypothetical protein